MKATRCMILLCCGILTIAATADARSGSVANEVLTAKSYHWQVQVGGRQYNVTSGGVLKYCAGATVERLTPVAVLTARSQGEHRYYLRLSGPRGAGKTPVTERVFRGDRALVHISFSAVQFEGLTKEANRPTFLPGAYRVSVRSLIGRAHDQQRLTLTERVRLVPLSSSCT
jgi:hypothetical protein